MIHLHFLPVIFFCHKILQQFFSIISSLQEVAFFTIHFYNFKILYVTV